MRLVASLILLTACGSPATETTPPPAGEPSVTVNEHAEPTESVCFEEERCDALDSDCDGRIDESCAPADADLQIGLAWNDDSSLTVAVSPALPATLSADPEGECGDRTQPRLARRFHAPLEPGDYQVTVSRTDACEAAESTRASISVSAFGELLGTYLVDVGGEPVDVVAFSVTR